MAVNKTIIADSVGNPGLTVVTSYGAGSLLVIEDPNDPTDDATGTVLAIEPADVIGQELAAMVPDGVLKGSAGVLGVATPGADYLAPTGSGAGLSGVVLTSGSYSQPSWLTSILGSIVSGNIPGNAASITGAIAEAQVTGLVSDLATLASAISGKATDNLVMHLAGLETITGAKTFSSAIVGDISGNAGTATNGVVTSGSYADPAWITGLAGSKITGNIAGNAASISGTITTSQVSDLSSWAGSTSLVTLGTVTSGTWSATAIAAAKGGTGLSALPTANQVLGVNAGGSAYEGKTFVGSGVTITHTANTVTFTVSGGTGTVTSVNMSVPSWLTVSGNPITTSGTLAVAAASGQAANQVIASPNGSTGAVSLRSLVYADLPTIATLNILANTTGGTAAPAANTISGIMDAAGSSTQGAGPWVRGASVWAPLSPGTSGFVLGSQGSGASQIWTPPRKPIFAITGIGTSVGSSTTAAVSVFTGVTVAGSLTIPANRLTVGSVLNIELIGDYDILTGDTPIFVVKLGSVVIGTGQVGASGSTVTGKHWAVDRFRFEVQTTTTGRGSGFILLYNTATALIGSALLTTGGGGTASTAATIDVTSSYLIDITVQPSNNNAANRYRLLAGSAWIDG